MIAARRRSHLLLAIGDWVVIASAYAVAGLTYQQAPRTSDYLVNLMAFLLAAVVVHVLAHHAFHLYRPMWRHAGMREARDLLVSSVMAISVLVTVHAIDGTTPFTSMPVNVVVFGGLLATLGVTVLRFRRRLSVPYRSMGRSRLRVAVIGSRDAGAAAISDMLSNPRTGLVPVAVFDDDGRAHGRSLLGVPVVGPITAIPRSKGRYRFDQVLLAIPSPSTALIHDVLRATEAAGVPMRLLPGMRDMAGRGRRLVHHPRPFRIEDLLGRQPVATDLDSVHRSLRSARILITGAGGSIGSEIARQIDRFHPERIILLDRDDTHLHDAAAGLASGSAQELVDIRDPDAVWNLFDRYHPSVVFHAAAHKHVPILETHPIEAARTNVFGTLNLVEAAAAHGTSRFVMISTDKAVRPTSVMGAAKLIGERILLAQQSSDTTFCAVRFGNVLGSRGSVIPTFSRQIASGGPVTVTDPLMTRFFMTIEEAVQLVLQASLLASGGDVFMLEMGEPVSILDLARRMIRLSGYAVGSEIEIEFVGCRPGEKLSEELCSPDEERCPTGHPSILRLASPSVHSDLLAKGLLQLQEAADLRESERVRRILFALAGPVACLDPVGSPVPV